MLSKSNSFTVSSAIATFFHRRGIRFVHQLSGGMIVFLADAFENVGINVINYRHEQAAGFSAEGESRFSGNPAIVMGTSGPGATNLITAMASAYFDSTPVIFITGQVNTKELKKNEGQRQNGFQELDIAMLCTSITKRVFKLMDVEDLEGTLTAAWEVSISDRMGPVLIDIPIDVQQLDVSKELENRISNFQIPQADSNGSLLLSEPNNASKTFNLFSEIARILNSARRPLILAGGGVRLDLATEDLRDFARRSGIPVVSSLMGIDSHSHEEPTYVGFIGSYGNRWANRSLYRSDVLLVLGSRLDIRQTGDDVHEFASNKFIVRVDVDEHELSGRVGANISIDSGIRRFLQELKSFEINPPSASDFLSEIEQWRRENPPSREQLVLKGVDPILAVKEIGRCHKEVAGYMVDVGQHQMWAAQGLSLSDKQRFITSGGLGSMGFALPASLGAALASGQRWVVITGDGCIQLSLAELQTLKQLNLPIVIYLFNNFQHGMVAQFQKENLERRYLGTRDGYSVPDFKRVVEAFDISFHRAKNLEELIEINRGLQNSIQEPSFVEIIIDQEYEALPKLGKQVKLGNM